MEDYQKLIELITQLTSEPTDKVIKIWPDKEVRVSTPLILSLSKPLAALLRGFPSMGEGLTSHLISPIVLGDENALKLMAIGQAAGFWDISPDAEIPLKSSVISPMIINIRLGEPASPRICEKCGKQMATYTPKAEIFDMGQEICNSCLADEELNVHPAKRPPLKKTAGRGTSSDIYTPKVSAFYQPPSIDMGIPEIDDDDEPDDLDDKK